MAINCIKEDPTKIRLSDCLACAGCLTSEDLNYFGSDVEEFKKIPKINISMIFTHQSKVYIYFKVKEKMELDGKDFTFNEFEQLFITFVKKFYSLSYFVDISYFWIYLNNKISSECPATVLYIEKVYYQYAKFLNTYRTGQQLAADFIWSRFNENKNPKIISVTHCYDMKDEIRRDNTLIDIFLGVVDFYQLIEKDLKEYILLNKINNDVSSLLAWEKAYKVKYLVDKQDKILTNIKYVTGKISVLNFLNSFRRNNLNLECDENQELYIFKMCEGSCMSDFDKDKIENFINMNINEYSSHNKSYLYNRKFKLKNKTTFAVTW